MDTMRISLFGKLQIEYSDRLLPDIDGQKAKELLCYLLVHPQRPHPREILASLFWDDRPSETSKKYLRHTLWQLQTYFKSACQFDCEQAAVASIQGILQVEPDWISLNQDFDLWLDIVQFEQTYTSLRTTAGEALNDHQFAQLLGSTELYCGDLLEGWYQDWCVYERERFQLMYLTMLDKLIDFYSVHQRYEEAIMRGLNCLRYDPARERTHRKLMHLYYLAGDRSAALRQYQTCVALLEEELGVGPADRTTRLYRLIQHNSTQTELSSTPADRDAAQQRLNKEDPTSAPQAVEQLQQIQATLMHLSHQVEECIQALNYRPHGHG